jgi:hypothetical protein
MTEASMGTAFLLVSAIAAFCGYQFRNRRSKQLMWFAAFLLFVPGLAWVVYSSIDLSECGGNLLKGMYCPEPLQTSTTLKIATKAFLLGLFGMWPAVFVSVPVAVVAIGMEWGARKENR